MADAFTQFINDVGTPFAGLYAKHLGQSLQPNRGSRFISNGNLFQPYGSALERFGNRLTPTAQLGTMDFGFPVTAPPINVQLPTPPPVNTQPSFLDTIQQLIKQTVSPPVPVQSVSSTPSPPVQAPAPAAIPSVSKPITPTNIALPGVSGGASMSFTNPYTTFNSFYGPMTASPFNPNSFYQTFTTPGGVQTFGRPGSGGNPFYGA